MSRNVVLSLHGLAAVVLVASLSSTAAAAGKLSKAEACRMGQDFVARQQSAYPKNRNFKFLSCGNFESISAQGVAQVRLHWSVEEHCLAAGCQPQYTKKSHEYTCRFYVSDQGWKLNDCH